MNINEIKPIVDHKTLATFPKISDTSTLPANQERSFIKQYTPSKVTPTQNSEQANLNTKQQQHQSPTISPSDMTNAATRAYNKSSQQINSTFSMLV